MGSGLSYSDILAIVSLVIGLQNLSENEQQSAHSEELIRQIDVDAANDRQAQRLLEELGRQFEEQNQMLREILKAVKK